jgi:acetyltransferase-like isoleucine patch superfamily enzyme
MASRERLIPALAALRARLERELIRSLYRRRGIEAVNDRLITAYRVERLLAAYGADIGTNVVVHGPLVIHNAQHDYTHLTIGDDVHLGRLTLLDLAAPVTIERAATVSMGVTILSHIDAGESPLRERIPRAVADTRVGSGSYIGANATILAGCHVGREAVVAAGALVNRPVPDGMTVAGVPAHPLEARS